MIPAAFWRILLQLLILAMTVWFESNETNGKT